VSGANPWYDEYDCSSHKFFPMAKAPAKNMETVFAGRFGCGGGGDWCGMNTQVSNKGGRGVRSPLDSGP
jgi:hypothetical protein